jgi:hypothetical protein
VLNRLALGAWMPQRDAWHAAANLARRLPDRFRPKPTFGQIAGCQVKNSVAAATHGA